MTIRSDATTESDGSSGVPRFQSAGGGSGPVRRMIALMLIIGGVLVSAGPGALALTGSYEPPWSWPVNPEPSVLRHFQPPPEKWLAGHRGVDLRTGAAQQIRSPAAGRVVFVGTVVDRPVITLDLGGGLLSSFEPVVSKLQKGEGVTEGQPIGTASTAPHCPVSCVHWGVRLNGEYVNPLNYVSDRRPSVLLPLGGDRGPPARGGLARNGIRRAVQARRRLQCP